MNGIKALAIVFIAVGILGLGYRGFTYTRETHAAQIGSLSLTVQDQRTVYLPLWAGVGAIVIGAGLLLVPAKV